jgi:hypothetical protein
VKRSSGFAHQLTRRLKRQQTKKEIRVNLTNFAGQNWLITPAALAVGEPPPQSIHDQKWLLVLTGVVTANLQGNSTSQWLNANLAFLPDMAGPNNSGPLNWAIAQYGIPKPPGQNYTIAFALDEWAPFVSLSAIFDQNQSIDAGFAVNVWRPNHFGSGIDALSGLPAVNLFTGVNADVGVRDTDAWILSLSYNITLRGRIVFPKIPVILFESNFEATPAGQPPSQVQAVGTAKISGPNVVISPAFVHTGNWLAIGPFSVQTGVLFDGIFTQAPGPGVYSFSAMMFMGSKPQSADANIGFNMGAGQEFLNLNFRADNRVYISTEATACTFPRDQPFPVQITLTVTTTSASAQIGVAGSVANYNLPEYPFSFGAVTFYQEAGHAGGPFDVTDIVVTYTAL